MKKISPTVCLLTALIFTSCAWSLQANIGKVKIQGYVLKVKEATTVNEQQRGLSGQKNLAKNQGMLFIYPNERPLHFWMHEMLIPIDIIWLNHACQVVFIEQNAQPCPASGNCPIYTANGQYVLETSAGFSARHHVVPGNRMQWSGCITKLWSSRMVGTRLERASNTIL